MGVLFLGSKFNKDFLCEAFQRMNTLIENDGLFYRKLLNLLIISIAHSA